MEAQRGGDTGTVEVQSGRHPEWWYSRCVHIEYWIHGGNSWMECIQRGSAAGDWRLREIDLSLGGGGVPTLCPPGAGITILGISFILFFSLAENQLKV